MSYPTEFTPGFFDESSKAWKKNKKRNGSGYVYCCFHCYVKGYGCSKMGLYDGYCETHYPSHMRETPPSAPTVSKAPSQPPPAAPTSEDLAASAAASAAVAALTQSSLQAPRTLPVRSPHMESAIEKRVRQLQAYREHGSRW